MLYGKYGAPWMDDLVRCAWSRPLVLKPLNQILATVMLLGLSLAPAASHAAEPSTDHDVVIVGAGVSGLYAAYTLINLGYDVLVVEAST
jgi:threonine dehydrogenase-like Zn-dependent dehydrogenase